MSNDYDMPVAAPIGFRGGFPGGFRGGFPRGGFRRGSFGRFGVFPFFFGPWLYPWYSPAYYPPARPCYTYDAYGRCNDRGYYPVMAPEEEPEALYASGGWYDMDMD